MKDRANTLAFSLSSLAIGISTGVIILNLFSMAALPFAIIAMILGGLVASIPLFPYIQEFVWGLFEKRANRKMSTRKFYNKHLKNIVEKDRELQGLFKEVEKTKNKNLKEKIIKLNNDIQKSITDVYMYTSKKTYEKLMGHIQRNCVYNDYKLNWFNDYEFNTIDYSHKSDKYKKQLDKAYENIEKNSNVNKNDFIKTKPVANKEIKISKNR